MNSPTLAVLAGLLILLIAQPLHALIMVGGKEPVHDNNWPAGSLDLANLKTRVGWWEGPPFGGGQYNFLYRGDTQAFQDAVDLFAKIKAPKLVLVVHDGGPAQSPFLRDGKDPKTTAGYDWSFTVWNPQNFNHLYNTPNSFFSARDPSGRFGQSVDPPQLDVFVEKDKGIDFSKVKVPNNVTVNDERADAAGFAGGSAVVGDVYDMTTSKPIPAARVSVANNSAHSEGDANADGHFELTKIPGGAYQITVSAKGYAPRLLGYAELRGNTLKRYVAELAPVALVRGSVLDTGGKPVPGITVRADSTVGPDGRGYILPAPPQAKTDEKGHFELTGLPIGHLQLFAYGDNYQMLDVLKIHAIPDDHLELRVTATGNVKGRVLSKDGKPATNGNIQIEPEDGAKLGSWGGSSNTKPDGSFEFKNVPPGTYILTAMATNPGPALRGKDPNAKKVIVKAGQTIEVDVTGR